MILSALMNITSMYVRTFLKKIIFGAQALMRDGSCGTIAWNLDAGFRSCWLAAWDNGGVFTAQVIAQLRLLGIRGTVKVNQFSFR